MCACSHNVPVVTFVTPRLSGKGMSIVGVPVAANIAEIGDQRRACWSVVSPTRTEADDAELVQQVGGVRNRYDYDNAVEHDFIP